MKFLLDDDSIKPSFSLIKFIRRALALELNDFIASLNLLFLSKLSKAWLVPDGFKKSAFLNSTLKRSDSFSKVGCVREPALS